MGSERRGGGEPETQGGRAVVDDEGCVCAPEGVVGIGRRVGGRDRQRDIDDVGRRWASAARHPRQSWD